MPDIPISAEQEAYIEALREQLDDEVTYGHVRRQDAVQYLIDHHREDGELDVSVGSVEDDADATGSSDGDGGNDGDDGTDPDGTGDDGASNDAGDGASAASAVTTGSTVEGSVQALNDTGSAGGESGGSDGSSATDDADGRDGGAGTEAAGEGTATIGNAQSEKVQQMMNLVDAHDDAWEETDSSGGKYRVELPDGSTESVPTKDDVRALLFKHYR